MIKQKQTNKEILKNCRFATPSTPHHLNLNCSRQLKLVDSIVDWTPFLVLLFTSVCFKYGMTNIVLQANTMFLLMALSVS
ncbi:hypothetical protein T12_16293 [Trichinella patagoniensis]|uniref:Uncharacterized protein n=1 Tax=Trichinella patagoniensis TaxID=990121 RepID=A0A0V0Z2Y9_9BILA|nr:hypothetical protein T12_16293 [Trichinella patagoniensis]